jgi:hypothetical protein
MQILVIPALDGILPTEDVIFHILLYHLTKSFIVW